MNWIEFTPYKMSYIAVAYSSYKLTVVIKTVQ